MFGIDSSELAIVALVALVVIGPKDLPRVMRMVGNWLAKGRAMTRHVRAGFDTMMREAELEEMQKAWAAQNEAIMKASALPDLGLSDPMAQLGQTDQTPAMPPETIDVAATPPVIEPAGDGPPYPAEPAPPVKPKRARAKAAAAPGDASIGEPGDALGDLATDAPGQTPRPHRKRTAKPAKPDSANSADTVPADTSHADTGPANMIPTDT